MMTCPQALLGSVLLKRNFPTAERNARSSRRHLHKPLPWNASTNAILSVPRRKYSEHSFVLNTCSCTFTPSKLSQHHKRSRNFISSPSRRRYHHDVKMLRWTMPGEVDGKTKKNFLKHRQRQIEAIVWWMMPRHECYMRFQLRHLRIRNF